MYHSFAFLNALLEIYCCTISALAGISCSVSEQRIRLFAVKLRNGDSDSICASDIPVDKKREAGNDQAKFMNELSLTISQFIQSR